MPVNKMGTTALNFAAQYNQIEMVRFLIESGADVENKR